MKNVIQDIISNFKNYNCKASFQSINATHIISFKGASYCTTMYEVRIGMYSNETSNLKTKLNLDALTEKSLNSSKKKLEVLNEVATALECILEKFRKS